MARKPADSQNKVLSRRVLVVIDRDMTAKTPRAVWQHEIPILEAVFGEGKVLAVESKALDEGFNGKVSPELLPFNKLQDPVLPPSQTNGLDWVFVGDARTEYDRLGSVYGSLPDENRQFVEHVYGRFQDGRFGAVVGAAEVEDLPEPQLRDLIKGYGFLPVLAPDSTDAEKVDAREKHKLLQSASQPALVLIAEELGVTLN
jgi:hypothetical protein